MKELALILTEETLNRITDTVEERLIYKPPVGVKPVHKSSSAKPVFSPNNEGLMVGNGRSEFWYANGVIVRVTWKLTNDTRIVEIVWEKVFPSGSTVPAM